MNRARLMALLFFLPLTMAIGQDCLLPSGNFIFQGDFGFGPDNVAPDTPYTAPSGYAYSLQPSLPTGAYTITNHTTPWAQAINGAWLEVEDLSGSPEGYMMVVNSTAEPTVFWEQTVDLCSGMEFQFFLDALNLYQPDSAQVAIPNLSLYINGVLEANLGGLPQNGEWQFLSHSFSVDPALDQLLIELRNDTPGEAGNDFAVENITLLRCDQPFDAVEVGPAPHCPGDTIRLLAQLPAAYEGYWSRWQVSSDGGQSWVDFGIPNEVPEFLAEGIPINASFRALIAESEGDLFNGLCLLFSNPVDIEYRAPEECLEVITTFSGLCAGELGDNVFPDGDFGSGEENILPFDPGLAPGYVYEFNPPPNDGTYTITNNTEPWGSFALDSWINIGDNSPDPNGYMMVVNAIPEPSLFYIKTVEVCENTLYEFSTDIISVNRPSVSEGFTQPNISFLINDVAVFNTGNVPIDSTWRTFGFTFTTAPGVSELTLALRNNTPGGQGFIGNDLALDNVSLRACGPPVSIAERTAAPYCPGDPITLAANVGSGFSDPQVQWQLFDEASGEWEDYGSPGLDTFITVPTLALGARFRLLVAETFQSLGLENCRVVSDEFVVAFDEIGNCFDSPVNMEGTICDGQLGFGAVPEGNFGSGPEVFGPELDPGATTLAYQDTMLPAEGFYSLLNFWEEDICPDTLASPCWWLPIEDNDEEDPEGYGMVVNGTGARREIIYTGRAEVFCENTTYQFSASVFNLSHPSYAPFNTESPDSVVLPKLDFILGKEGTPLELLQVAPANYNTGEILNDTTWRTYGFTFTVQPGTDALALAIRNNASEGFGNDFILDNINISPCGGPMAIQREGICPGESVTLEGVFGNSFFPNPAIQWQQSTDEGLSWSKLPGETNPSLFLTNPQAGQQHRFLIAENPANLNIPTCLIPSPVDTMGFLVQFADTLNQAICQGESVQLGNTTFTEEGQYQIPFMAANGCDSIVTLNLAVNPVFSENITAAICEGESLLFDGRELTEAGPYTGVFQTVAGCDSTVILSLQVIPAIRENISAAICPGESFPFGSEELTEGGTYEAAFTAANGCDSLVTLELTVNLDYIINTSATLCEGESLDFAGQELTASGEYEGLFGTVDGCDSLVMLNLTVLTTVRDTIAADICEGERFNFGGEALTAAGTYEQMLTDQNGCDSFVTLQLMVWPNAESMENLTICEGESVPFGNEQLTTAGTYQFTYQTVNGCDSLATLELEVLPLGRDSLRAEICEGETFSFNGNELGEAGFYEQILTGNNGCDSITTLELDVFPVYDSEETVQLCRGDTFEGVEVFTDTTIVFEGQTLQGCDSILTYRILVEDLSSFRIRGEGQFCGSGSSTLSANGDFAAYAWSTGATTAQITVDQPGRYTLTVSSALGCTAVDSIEVEEVEFLADIEGLDPLCNGEETGAIRVTGLRGGTPPFRFRLDETPFQDNGLFNGLAAGTYQLLVQDSSGCEIREEVQLDEPASLQVSISGEDNIALGDSTLLQVEQGGDSLREIAWKPAAGLSCTDCLGPMARPDRTTTYTFTAQGLQGCLVSVPFTITVKDTRSVYVPSAFSPNDDGANDFFTVFPGKGMERILQFRVFDRWGNTVFESGERELGAIPRWDGSFRGQKMNPGVFVWQLEVAFVDGTTRAFEGEVVLLR